MLNKFQFQILICSILILLFAIISYYNYKETLVLEKELIRLEKELYLKQLPIENKQIFSKEYRKQLLLERDRLKKAIDSLK